MNSFLKEPARLASEQQRIRGDMVELALKHYPVFVSASGHHQDIMSELKACRDATESIVSGVAGLTGHYDDFVEHANKWKQSRVDFGSLLAQHTKIQEIIEAPHLLDTCFRNEMFHEAVLVLQHVKTITDHHANLPFIVHLADEVEGIVNTNVVNLLQKLSSPALPIPLCINIVSLLKRLGVCNDRELRFAFLTRRFSYIESAIDEARALTSTPYAYVSKLTNVIKMQLCEVVTQYETCFSNSTETHKRLSAHDRDVEVACADPLYGYAFSALDTYILTLRAQVQLITSGADLASLMEQSMSCCVALARIRLDVSPLVASVFTDRIVQLFTGHIDAARSTFSVGLQSHSFAGKTPVMPTMGSTDAALMLFHPIAFTTNDFLTGCNELRKCAAACVAPTCVSMVRRFLEDVVRQVCDVHRTSAFEPDELEHFAAFAHVIVDDFVPHCCRAVDTLFDTNAMNGHRREIVAPLFRVLESCCVAEPAPPNGFTAPSHTPLPQQHSDSEVVNGQQPPSPSGNGAVNPEMEGPLLAEASSVGPSSSTADNGIKHAVSPVPERAQPNISRKKAD
eukprot:PhM_4_TR17633/c0_g1_i1/m.18985/K20295/COG8; conserved oligomeric Golgi complex subunit 8